MSYLRYISLSIPFTFFIALLLTLLPMPTWTAWVRPAWVPMTVIFWVMMTPKRMTLLWAWCVGLLLDALNGTLLGEHALAMIFVAYFVSNMHLRLRMFPLMQQGFSVLLLILFYQFVLFCVQGFLGQLPSSPLYWLSPVTSMVLWPWVCGILRNSWNQMEAT